MSARRYLALVSALSIAGCAGSGPSAPLVPNAGAPDPQPAATRHARVTFALRWPQQPVAIRGRKPAFVSPSTMSVIVTVTKGAAKTTAVANNTGKKIAAIALQAPVGSDLFTVSLYDAKQSVPLKKPAGKLLGQVSLVQKIVAGKTNVVRATVNGVVHSVSVAPVPGQTALETTRGGYAIVGQHVATFAVTPLDADGNAIVAPGITPAVSLTNDPSNSYFAVLPGASASQFDIAVTAPAPPDATPTFTARATDARNTTVKATLVLEQRPEVYVSYAGGTILAFDDAGNSIALGPHAFSGLQQPVSLAYDSVDQTLFVADATSGSVEAFDPDGVPKSGFTPPTLASITGVTWDSSSTMATVDAASASTAIVANARTGLPSGDAAVRSPFAVTTGAGIAYVPPTQTQSDVLLVADQSTQQLDAYTPYGSPTLFGLQHVTVGPPAGTPGQVAADPTGNIAWVTGTVASGGEIWRLPLEASSPPETAVADGNAPAGLAYDASIDRLFVAESSGANVVAYQSDLSAIDPSIVLAPPASSSVTNPYGVAIAY